MSHQPVYSVTDFVAICNQVLDMSFGSVQITGELAQLRVSKNRWVYFDLKDDYSSIRFFGTVYQLPGPLEDGMVLTVRGVPKLHPKFGFSITIQSIQLAGEGTIKKAAQLLEAKLEKEGLFSLDRKRQLPYPPKSIGLITSGESAAYADFVKITNERWGGLEIALYDVQVQGEGAPAQIVEAIAYFNSQALQPEVLAVIRGGGSADDLQAFNTETVTRAIAASRIPTIVAIGHEVDTSLAEKAADVRASTPSNAAQLLTPDRNHEAINLRNAAELLHQHIIRQHELSSEELRVAAKEMLKEIKTFLQDKKVQLEHSRQTLTILSPSNVLKRGYAIVRQNGKVVPSASRIKSASIIELQFQDGKVSTKLKETGSV